MPGPAGFAGGVTAGLDGGAADLDGGSTDLDGGVTDLAVDWTKDPDVLDGRIVNGSSWDLANSSGWGPARYRDRSFPTIERR